MHARILFRGSVSLAAILASGAAAVAQQSLPTIDVGAGRRPAAVRAPARPAPAPVRVARPAPAPVQVAAPARPAPPPRRALPENIPGVVNTVTRDEIDRTTNSLTVAGTLKYLPSILVRERYTGDRNSIVIGRVNGSVQSAETLVYADNVLLSNLLNNSFANPPRWGMVSPSEVERIDVIAGPFSALYPGNSRSGVVVIQTRQPEKFEIHAAGTGSYQFYSLYGSKEHNVSGDMNILVGDKLNNFSYWLSYDRLDAQGQSQTYPNGNLTNPTITAGVNRSNIPIFGGWNDVGESGYPRLVNGAAGRDHAETHMAKAKFTYELAPKITANYQIGFWSLIANTFVTPYTSDKNGVPLYNVGGGTVRVGNNYYSFGAINPGHSNASHLMQSFSFKSDTKGVFDFDFSGSSYNYLREYTNSAAAYGLTPAVSAAGVYGYSINPRGSNVNQGGTFWRTGDARGIFRPPGDYFGKHEISFGAHADLYSLNSVQTSTNVFTSNYYNSISAINYGKTETKGIYAQDVWQFLPKWKLTLGARGDFWSAFGGANISNNGASAVLSPASYKQSFSPKGALEYQVTPEFLMRGGVFRAYRYPTVGELFQSLTNTANNTATFGNPYLQPEVDTYYELTGEYAWNQAFGGRVGLFKPRVSLFKEDLWNAIQSQIDISTPIRTNQSVNMDKVGNRGVEAALEMRDVIWNGLDINGNVTFTDSKILANWRQPQFVGNQFPRIPRIRIRGTVNYHPSELFSIGFGVRYQSAAFVSLANTDFNHNNYGSIDSEFLVFDARATYKLSKEWTLNAGIDNIGRQKYYVNPNPYPQRTYTLGLKYDYVGASPGVFLHEHTGL